MMHHKHILPLLALLLASCELETSGNGALDGYWQMARIDSLPQGGSKDMTGSRLYWAVESGLLQVSDLGYRMDSYLFHFEHADGTLRLYDAHRLDRNGGDVAVTDAAPLKAFGIHALEAHFRVEQLDGEQMQLRSDSLRIVFNRY